MLKRRFSSWGHVKKKVLFLDSCQKKSSILGLKEKTMRTSNLVSLQLCTAVSQRWLWMEVRTPQLCQRRQHCLCVPQLNNVQALVQVLVRRLHCETSTSSFVHTLVLESQVRHRNMWVECFSSLDHNQPRDLCPEFLERRRFGTNERIVNMWHQSCFVRLVNK